MTNRTSLIHPVYLPFSREQLAPHFSQEKYLDYFATSAIRYSEFMARFGAKLAEMPITDEVRLHRQIEKDERFWTTCTLKSVFDAEKFSTVLRLGFGETPPFADLASWEQCVGERGTKSFVSRSLSPALSFIGSHFVHVLVLIA